MPEGQSANVGPRGVKIPFHEPRLSDFAGVRELNDLATMPRGLGSEIQLPGTPETVSQILCDSFELCRYWSISLYDHLLFG